MKILTVIAAINLFLLSECNTMKNTNNNKTYLNTDIEYSNTKLSMNYNDSKDLILLAEKLLSECNDIYELIVTDKFIHDIKQNEDYLEIIYPVKREIKIGDIETIEIYSLFIPLSGKFAGSNQLSFFCGYPKYSSGPYNNSNGAKVLNDIISRYKGNK